MRGQWRWFGAALVLALLTLSAVLALGAVDLSRENFGFSDGAFLSLRRTGEFSWELFWMGKRYLFSVEPLNRAAGFLEKYGGALPPRWLLWGQSAALAGGQLTHILP